MPLAETRSEKIDLRLSPSAKLLLQRAAAEVNQSVSEFVLRSAMARAEETLPDRRYFGLDAKKWAQFLDALDAPAKPSPRLRKLLREPSVFERGSLD